LLPVQDRQLNSNSLRSNEGVNSGWYKIITDAYFWLPKTDFKKGSGKNTRYMPLAISFMIELKSARANGQTADEWIASIRAKTLTKSRQS
jgi:hypothetical protein